MWSTPSLPLHTGPLWSRAVVPVWVLSIGQIEVFNPLLYLKPFNCTRTINSNTWNHLRVSPVSWGCRIHQLHLCRGIRHPTNACPRYDTKQSDGEVLVILELWGMQRTPSLPLLLGPLCSGVVAPDRVLSMDQIELNCVLMLNWIAWNRTVFTFKLCTYVKLNCLKWICFSMLN